MDYLSNNALAIIEKLKKLDFPSDSKEYIYIKETIKLCEDMAGHIDLANNKIEELEMEIEELRGAIKDIQEVIVKNLDLEPIEKPEQQDDFDEERVDDFYTLQCPFCEELFFIEKEELDQEVDCPFCNKKVVAVDNLVKK